MFVLLVCLSDLRSDFEALDRLLTRQASLVLKKSIKSSCGIEAWQSQLGGVTLPEIALPHGPWCSVHAVILFDKPIAGRHVTCSWRAAVAGSKPA